MFPDFGNLFGPFFIFFIVISVISAVIFIIVIVFIFKFFFGGRRSNHEEPSAFLNNQSNPYAAKSKSIESIRSTERELTKKSEPSNCPYCGAKIEPNQKFCSGCGAALD